MVDNNKLFIFGGTDGQKYYSDVYVLDLELLTWTEIKTTGNIIAREGHSSILYDNMIFIFGGGNDKKIYNDLYSFDIENLKFKQTNPSSNLIPSQRIHHTCNIIGNKMIIFGGVGKYFSNELFVFDFEQNCWKKENISDVGHNPPCLYGHTSFIDGPKIWILGGRTTDKLSEGYIYSLDTHLSIVEPLDVGKNNLTTDLLTMLNIKDYSDLEIKTKDSSYFSHQSLIKIRCPLLYKKVKDNIIELDKEYKSFLKFLEFLYSDIIYDYDQITEDEWKELNELSIEYNLERLNCLLNEKNLPFSSLSSDMNLVLKEAFNTDISFELDSENVNAHKYVLISRSNIVMLFEEENIKIKPHIFKLILEYLYSGSVKIEFDYSIELLISSEALGIERLSRMCQNLIQKKINIYNVSRILNIADQYDIIHLRKACISFIMLHFNQVQKTNGFKTLDKEIKVELKDLKKVVKKLF